MTSFFALIISICKTSAIVDKWAMLFLEQYTQSKIDGINGLAITIEAKKAILLSKISEAKTHEEKRILFSAYNDINKL